MPLKIKHLKSKVRKINLKLILLNQLKLILDTLFRILCRRYHPMQFCLRAGVSSLAQASFFLICMGDSAYAGYLLCVMPRPGFNKPPQMPYNVIFLTETYFPIRSRYVFLFLRCYICLITKQNVFNWTQAKVFLTIIWSSYQLSHSCNMNELGLDIWIVVSIRQTGATMVA